jgi:hypothetical protein
MMIYLHKQGPHFTVAKNISIDDVTFDAEPSAGDAGKINIERFFDIVSREAEKSGAPLFKYCDV